MQYDYIKVTNEYSVMYSNGWILNKCTGITNPSLITVSKCRKFHLPIPPFCSSVALTDDFACATCISRQGEECSHHAFTGRSWISGLEYQSCVLCLEDLEAQWGGCILSSCLRVYKNVLAMALLQPGSVCMSVTTNIIKGLADSRFLDHHMWPCCCLKATSGLHIVTSKPRLLMWSMSRSVVVLLLLGSMLMSLAHVAMEDQMDACSLGRTLWPCWNSRLGTYWS